VTRVDEWVCLSSIRSIIEYSKNYDFNRYRRQNSDKMVESTGMKCVKVLMIIFNVLFLLGGLALIIVGAILQAQSSKINYVNSAAVLVLVLGCVIFLLAFLGCCGAKQESRCLLLTFGILMIIIFVVSIAAIIVAFVFKSQTEKILTDPLMASLKSFNPNDTATRTLSFWPTYQYDQKCCGMNNYSDWLQNTYLQSNTVPASCCGNNNPALTCPVNQLTPDVAKTGCLSILMKTVEGAVLVVGAVMAAVAILQILGIIFAFALAHAIHKGYNVV